MEDIPLKLTGGRNNKEVVQKTHKIPTCERSNGMLR